MRIVFGLGNPGAEYENTRHNAGFMAVDKFAARKGLKFVKGRGSYRNAKFRSGNKKFFLVKPTTFMNLSGVAVRDVINFYKITELSNILIVLDDINLPFGVLRLRPGGSDGGQKGLRSIISYLGTTEVPRLRIGIGTNFADASKYVLSPFKKGELEDLAIVLEWAVDAIESFVTEGVALTMSRFNRNVLIN